MPEPRVYTPIYGWPMVRKASSVNEARDWFQEQIDFTNAIELTVNTIDNKIPGDFYVKATDNASDVNLETINGAGLDTVQDWMDTVQGTGLIDGGALTDNGDGTVDVASGRVVGKTLAADGSPTGFYSFPATEDLELIDNDINFIYVCYNGGTPLVQTSNTSKSAERDCVGIQIAYREGTTLHLANYGPDAYSLLNLLSVREAEIATGSGSPATRAFGLIAGDSGTRNVTLTSGVVYASLRRGVSNPFDTSVADDFVEYYGSTANGWTSSTQTQVNNTDYNNGTTLTALSVNRYSTRWLYIDYNLDNISIVIGPGNYLTESAALDEDTPSDLPMYLQKFGILVGQYVIQNGSDAMVVRSPFESTFTLGSVTSHTGLSNINADLDNNHLSTTLISQITTNQDDIATNAADIVALESGITNVQTVTTATANIAATTSIVDVDMDTIGAACALTVLTAGVVNGRSLTIVASGTDIEPVTIVGQGGQTFNGAASVQIVNDNRSLTLEVLDGNFIVVNPADCQFVWDYPVVKVTDTVDDTPGAQLATNGDFFADVTGWAVGNSATVTWQAGGIARIAYNTVTNPYISQDILEIGIPHVFVGRARGDGTNIPELKASGTVWAADNATEWRYFSIIHTPTATRMDLTSGGATSGYVEWDYQYVRPLREAPTTDRVASWLMRGNDIIHPNDLSQTGTWFQEQAVNGGPTEIIGSSSSGSHARSQNVAITAGDRVVYFNVKAGNKDWVRVFISDGTARVVYVNVTTLEIGDVSNVDDYRVSCAGDGYCLIEVFIKDAAASSMFVGIYPAVSGTSVNYTGDDVTVDLHAKGIGTYSGTIQDNVGFADGGASAYELQLKQEYPYDFHLKHADGFALTAEGAWESISKVIGFPMDESPSNVDAMHQAGIYKVVSNNTWRPLVAGTQFYAPSGNFLELFEDTATSSTTITLTPSATPPTNNGANPLHSTGTVYSPNDTVEVGSYCGATSFAGVRNFEGSMQLIFSTVYTDSGDRGYRVEIEYEWRNIVAP